MSTRLLNHVVIAFPLVVGACGRAPVNADSGGKAAAGAGGAQTTSPCDGSGAAIPPGFPPLGAHGCGAHVVYTRRGQTVDLRSEGGTNVVGSAEVIRVAPSGARDDELRILLPSLDVTAYDTSSCAVVEVATGLGTPYSPRTGGTAQSPFMKLETVGTDGNAVWGRVSGNLCRITSSDYVLGAFVYTYACEDVQDGTFSATISTSPSPAPTDLQPPSDACAAKLHWGVEPGSASLAVTASASNVPMSTFSGGDFIGHYTSDAALDELTVEGQWTTGGCAVSLLVTVPRYPHAGDRSTLDRASGASVYLSAKCADGDRVWWTNSNEPGSDVGAVTITAVTKSDVAVRLDGALLPPLAPAPLEPPNPAQGTLRISGTIDAVPTRGL